jgi:hypothetical protein
MARKPLNRGAAEEIAVEAFTFLSEDENRLRRFLAVSGLRVDTLRAAAGSPNFLAGVLDYIVLDDELVTSLADRLSARPEDVAMARQVLSPVEE